MEDRSIGRKRLLAAGGLIGAILASSCCIAPLLLLTLGVTGAWMGSLTALAPYQGYFMTATIAFLAAGYWYVYFKPMAKCDDNSRCATQPSDRVVKVALWIATALVALALSINFVVPLLL